MKFDAYCPTRVLFGPGRLQNIGSIVPSDSRSVLVLSSPTAAERSGAFDTIKASLSTRKKLGFAYNNGISPNPKVRELDLAAKHAVEARADVIIAVGGGSVIDAGKVIALAAKNDSSCADLLNAGIEDIDPVFLIAVPTTAGTGSEISKGAIITDDVTGWKGGVRGDNVFPAVAIVDPTLLASVPRLVARETGFDIFTHAFESLVSKARTPLTMMYSREILQRLIPGLIELADSRVTPAVQEELALCSMMAGYNLANSSTCLPHRLQYPVGAATDTSHAAGLAALYPAWCRETSSSSPEEFDFVNQLIAQALGEVYSGFSNTATMEIMIKFLERLEIRRSLTDLGLDRKDCDRLVEQVSGNLALDPGYVCTKTTDIIYRESF